MIRKFEKNLVFFFHTVIVYNAMLICIIIHFVWNEFFEVLTNISGYSLIKCELNTDSHYLDIKYNVQRRLFKFLSTVGVSKLIDGKQTFQVAILGKTTTGPHGLSLKMFSGPEKKRFKRPASTNEENKFQPQCLTCIWGFFFWNKPFMTCREDFSNIGLNGCAEFFHNAL